MKLQVEQAREGSANEDHFCRDMKRTIKTSDMALQNSFGIAIDSPSSTLQVLLTHELCFP